MKGGSLPKNAELKELEGNRGHRPIKHGVKGQPINLKVPDWLSDKKLKGKWQKVAIAEFEKMEAYLSGLKILTLADHALLEAYSIIYAKWSYCECMSDEMVSMEDGSIKVNPFIKIAQGYLIELRRIAEQFGMSPSARCKLDVKEDLTNSEESEFIKYFER